MFDPERLLKQMVGGALGGSFGGGRRKAGGIGSALGINKAQMGLGLLGVAMAAYDHYSRHTDKAATGASSNPAAAPPKPPSSSVAPPPPPPGMSAPTRAQPMLDLHKQEAALMVRAMIAAAAADGLIDASERQRIVERARDAGDDPDTLAYLETELANPATREQLIAQTPRSLAHPVYVASVLAIAVDSVAERGYLDDLAAGLGINAETRARLHSEIGA
ncbi:MAG: DUF533 domain-containing protein [Pseudomarimonas sp.]